MGTTVDSLDIQLQMQSQRAITSIDTLISRLGTLNASLTKINGSGLTGVANGVNKLSNAMQGMKSVGTADFTRLANNITKIASLDSKSINRAASAIGQISKSLGSLKSVSVSGTSKQVAELANGIAKLGYKSSTKAIENIPKLATAMRDLMSSLSKAPKVSQNIIDMTNALAKLARTGASSGKAATSLSRSLDTYTKSTSKASSGTKGLASALGKMYASYWLLFRAFQKIGQSITLASDLVEVQNVVNTVFGDMTAKVEQYADRSIEQFGMSELAFKQYASRFQAMGSAMGIDSGLIGQANSFLNKSTNGYVALSDSMADVSLTLTQLTADMASFYNVEQSAVAEDLAAIFTGETRPLRTYGLDLTQATLSEWAMKQGLDANIQSMSQAEKTMLRYQYVLANTTAAQNDFQRTANSWANQLRILQEQLKKWASVIGTGFIAAFKPFLQTLNTVMARVIDFTENVLNALGNIFGWKFEITGGGITDDLADSMGDTAVDTGDAAGSAGDLSDNLGDAAANAKKLYSTVLGIDELNINNPNTGSTGSGSGGSGGTGGSGSGGAGAGTGTGLNTTISRNDAILKAYESSIDSLYELGEYIGNTLTKTLNSIDWDSVYQGARNFGKGLADFLNGLISPELFGAVGRTIAGALNTAIYAALSFGENFDFYDFGVSIATGINEFFRTFDFGALAQTLNVWVKGIWTTLRTAVLNIDWISIFKGIFDFVDNIDLGTVLLLLIPNTKKITKSLGLLEQKFKSITKYAKAVAGAFTGNVAAIKILTGRFPKLGKAIDVVGDSFQRLMFGIHYGDIKGGINAALSNIRNNLTKIQKGVIGAISVFAEFSLAKDAFYDIASGGDNLVESLGKITLGAGAAAVALKFIGLSNPLTAIITGATALVSALIGINSAMTDIAKNSMFETLRTTGTVTLQDLGNVAKDSFEKITSGVDSSIEKLNQIETTKESIDNTVVSIDSIRAAIDNGAYTASEKVPEIIEQFQSLLDQSKSIFNEEYNTIVGNVVGAWADILEAQGQTVPEVVAQLASLRDQGTSAYSDLESSINGLIEQYQNGTLSAEDFYNKSMPLFDQLKSFNDDGAVDQTTQAIRDLGGSLDLSQYITEDSFDTSAFQSYMDTVIQTATEGKDNLKTLGEENNQALQDYKSQLESLGIDTSQFDWAALYGASDEQVSKGISNIDSAYQDYADQIQYALLNQLPSVVEDATKDYDKLNPFQKIFTSEEKYVNDAIDSWEESILTPVTSSIQDGFEQLGIDGQAWAGEASEKLVDSIFNSITTYTSNSMPVTTETLKENWKTILDGALKGAEGAVDAESYGKDTVEGYNSGISSNAQSSYDKIQEWMDGIDKSIHDSSMAFGSPSKTAKNYGKDTVTGYNNGLIENLPSTKAVINSYMSGVANSFATQASKIGKSMVSSFSSAWSEIREIFLPAIDFFGNTFNSAYNSVKLAFQPMNLMFHSEWDDTKAVFKDVQSFFKSAFTNAYKAITSAFSGLDSFFMGIANDIVDPIESAINGVIRGMNWILDEVGSSKNISLWSAPNFATGSNGVPQDTLGVVNDQPGSTYKELIVPPSGKPFIPEGRNVMLPLEKGTKIMPAKQTKAFMSGMPHFAKGIGDFFGSAWKSYSSYTGDILDYMNKPKELLQIATDKYTNISGWKSSVGTMAAYTAKTIVDNAVSYISKIMDEMLTVKYNPSAGVEQWRNLAAKALQMTGQYSASNLNLLLYQMQTESGGNPNAINNWDINAKNGTPSKGLMQVIDPTFKAYAMKGYNTNIYDPLSNMIAAIRYTVSRYGSLANGWKGHGYASGIGKINLSDLIPAYEVGGFPEDGLFFANHNELVGRFDNGRTVVANNTNIQSGIKEGVKEAVAEILAPYLQQIADNTRETADKDFTVDVDGRSLVSAYDRRKSRNGFSFT